MPHLLARNKTLVMPVRKLSDLGFALVEKLHRCGKVCETSELVVLCVENFIDVE